MKQAIIFGAGNIGRGFMGQLFSESGYFVTFADVDRTLLEALNAKRSYVIRLVTNERTEVVEVGPLPHCIATPTSRLWQMWSRTRKSVQLPWVQGC